MCASLKKQLYHVSYLHPGDMHLTIGKKSVFLSRPKRGGILVPDFDNPWNLRTQAPPPPNKTIPTKTENKKHGLHPFAQKKQRRRRRRRKTTHSHTQHGTQPCGVPSGAFSLLREVVRAADPRALGFNEALQVLLSNPLAAGDP